MVCASSGEAPSHHLSEKVRKDGEVFIILYNILSDADELVLRDPIHG